jgi:hypothetical protein
MKHIFPGEAPIRKTLFQFHISPLLHSIRQTQYKTTVYSAVSTQQTVLVLLTCLPTIS